jgi:UDP-N-acetylglucosamine 4,6-dehydratase
VKRVVAISTDKAVSPVNLYGATKLVMEKLVAAANTYVRYRDICFSLVRYGNVVGSRGSVIPLFADLIADGCCELPITDERMTRFWITLEQGVDLVLKALQEAKGGETFIPKIPSMSMIDLVEAMPVPCTTRLIGRRPGEKIHETLISESEGERTLDYGDHYVVYPENTDLDLDAMCVGGAHRTPAGFTYESDKNTEWVSAAQMHAFLEKFVSSE